MEREPFTTKDPNKCKLGHEYVWNKKGSRRLCVVCQEAREKSRVPFATRVPGKCRHGHDLVWRKDGKKRYCAVCQSQQVKKARSNPEVRARLTAYVRKHRQANVERYRAQSLKRYGLRIALIRDIKVLSGCIRCGEKHVACLEFHHHDPAQKEENIGSRAGHMTIRKIMAEVAKCDILCSNCHRKHHWEDPNKPKVGRPRSDEDRIADEARID
jgi:hypothetical protein